MSVLLCGGGCCRWSPLCLAATGRDVGGLTGVTPPAVGLLAPKSQTSPRKRPRHQSPGRLQFLAVVEFQFLRDGSEGAPRQPYDPARYVLYQHGCLMERC